MSEYVDRQAMINAVLSRYAPGMSGMKSEALRKIMENVPAADVVEVIRCKDCNLKDGWFCVMTGKTIKPDDFCSRGVRRLDACPTAD